MIYASIDTETTGLNPETCNLLEIGIIIEDTLNKRDRQHLPALHLYNYRDTYNGEPFALGMNGHIFKKIAELKKENSPLLVNEADLVGKINQFLDVYDIDFGFPSGKIVPAGKNFASFDLQFIKKLPDSEKLVKRFHHRTLDPGPLFIDFNNDKNPPDLAKCKERSGLEPVVIHDSLDDAWDVIRVLRTKY